MSSSLYDRAPKALSPSPERWVDIHRAAEHLSVTTRWLYAEGDRAGVPCARVGRARRYLLSHLTAFMIEREGAA
ncbi:hypothetical protein Cpa01nite_33150 [Cellulomonas pakistanensis]|uniref:Helix-turn-helix domain-containing protein n=1 Tax=Cellulomonas pakistanensis TaxID=992287 RepID=A0A919PBF6_9CELL|nr:hypothetical protein Cpa01nite_33150 [Cellulomonas pakistanensis]